MSKEVTRFKGALLVIGSVIGGLLITNYFEDRAIHEQEMYESTKRLGLSWEEEDKKEAETARSVADGSKFVVSGVAGLLSTYGLWLLIVAPRNKQGETEEEDTYMVVWTTGKNASDPNIRDDYQSGLTYREAVAKYDEVAALDSTYIASIVAVVESTDYSPHSKHA